MRQKSETRAATPEQIVQDRGEIDIIFVYKIDRLEDARYVDGRSSAARLRGKGEEAGESMRPAISRNLTRVLWGRSCGPGDGSMRSPPERLPPLPLLPGPRESRHPTSA